ncbi:MAG: hypothetical protein OXF11_05360, partial [Deltaproteobacteria bacterium]|nr:hypothetical protein [Deltaproteobacteria bacterium]
MRCDTVRWLSFENAVQVHALRGAGGVTAPKGLSGFRRAAAVLTAAFTAAAVLGLAGVARAQTPGLSVADVTVSESAGNATFRVTLTETATVDVTADYATSSSAGATAATVGADFTTSSGSVTIAMGQSEATFMVPVLSDIIDEQDETFTVTLSGAAPSGTVTISDATATGTITDDDPAPQLEFIVSPASITERGGTSMLTIGTGSGSTYEGDEQITFTLAGGSTGDSADYTISPSPPLTLPAGMGTMASTVTARLTAVADMTPADETLVLVAMHGTETIGTRTVTLTKPTLSIADATATETDASGTMNFTVTLSEAVNEQVTVDYATASTGATATAGADYTAATGTVTFAANVTTASFAVTVLGDNIDETDQETFTVTLSAASGNVRIEDGSATGTINDDDAAPAPTVSLNTPIAEAGGTSTITVSTGTGSTYETARTVTLMVTGEALDGPDYTIDTKTLELPAGVGTAVSTVTTTVTAVDDKIDENDDGSANDQPETIMVSASIAGSGIGEVQTVHITDDDAAPAPALALSSPVIAEPAGALTVTVSTDAGATFETARTITLEVSGEATENEDYTLTKTLTLPAGTGTESTTVTTTVTVVDDLIDENDDGNANDVPETFTISAKVGSAPAFGTQTVSITDDDDAPAPTVSVTPEINEAGGISTVTVSTVGGSTYETAKVVTLTYTGVAVVGTAAVGADYTVGDMTLTLPAGTGIDPKMVTTKVMGVDDKIDDNNDGGANEVPETVEVGASIDGGAIGATQTIRIRDDDAAPVLLLAVATTPIDEAGGTSTVTVHTGSGSTYPIDETITLVTEGTATLDEDYEIGAATLTLPAGVGTGGSTVTTTVTALQDGNYEGVIAA